MDLVMGRIHPGWGSRTSLWEEYTQDGDHRPRYGKDTPRMGIMDLVMGRIHLGMGTIDLVMGRIHPGWGS